MTANSIKIEGAECIITLAGPDKVRLFKELAPCECVTNKSKATEDLRARFRAALLDPPVRWPIREVHGLRVALGHCAGHPPKIEDKDSVRGRLSSQLAKVGR